jgi:hypothetical protein
VAGHIDRLVEGVRGGEVVRDQNVEYSPQLVEVVLERRAGEEQSVVAREARERTMQPARLILEVMRFVHHEDDHRGRVSETKSSHASSFSREAVRRRAQDASAALQT